MATRALIGHLSDDGKVFASTYNHYDGYPEGLGKILNKHYTLVLILQNHAPLPKNLRMSFYLRCVFYVFFNWSISIVLVY